MVSTPRFTFSITGMGGEGDRAGRRTDGRTEIQRCGDEYNDTPNEGVHMGGLGGRGTNVHSRRE